MGGVTGVKKILSKVWGIALIALSAMVFVQPVTADDCSLTIEADPVEVKEGNKAVFRIKVQCAASFWRPGSKFRYKFQTQDDSAGRDDYKWRSGSHVFSRGSTSTRRVTVKTYDDDECEGDEEFKLNFTLEGKVKGSWHDWSGGAIGLPGTFWIKGVIEDQTTSGCGGASSS